MSRIGTGKNYDLTSNAEDHEEFNKWLQCYNQPDMDSMADHNKRMVWFKVSFSYIIITFYLPSLMVVGRSWPNGSHRWKCEEETSHKSQKRD